MQQTEDAMIAKSKMLKKLVKYDQPLCFIYTINIRHHTCDVMARASDSYLRDRGFDFQLIVDMFWMEFTNNNIYWYVKSVCCNREDQKDMLDNQ